MKRILLLACLIGGMNAQAQLGQYPNSNFEIWEASDSLVSLQGWTTTYPQDANSARRITDAQDQQFAIHLETTVNQDEDTVTGFWLMAIFLLENSDQLHMILISILWFCGCVGI